MLDLGSSDPKREGAKGTMSCMKGGWQSSIYEVGMYVLDVWESPQTQVMPGSYDTHVNAPWDTSKRVTYCKALFGSNDVDNP